MTEPCDLCAENGITTPAVADVKLPWGPWANVCEAHRYRIEGPRPETCAKAQKRPRSMRI